jgi:hypothetical protein
VSTAVAGAGATDVLPAGGAALEAEAAAVEAAAVTVTGAVLWVVVVGAAGTMNEVVDTVGAGSAGVVPVEAGGSAAGAVGALFGAGIGRGLVSGAEIAGTSTPMASSYTGRAVVACGFAGSVLVT